MNPVIGMDHFLDSIGLKQMNPEEQAKMLNEIVEEHEEKMVNDGCQPLQGVVYSKELGCYIPRK